MPNPNEELSDAQRKEIHEEQAIFTKKERADWCKHLLHAVEIMQEEGVSYELALYEFNDIWEAAIEPPDEDEDSAEENEENEEEI